MYAFSVLDVELDLVSELWVVWVASLELEVHQEAEMVVETKEVILLILVLLQDLLEVWSLRSLANVSRPTVEAVAVHWGKWLDVDALLLVDNRLIVVSPAAMVAAQFVLLNGKNWRDGIGV